MARFLSALVDVSGRTGSSTSLDQDLPGPSKLSAERPRRAHRTMTPLYT